MTHQDIETHLPRVAWVYGYLLSEHLQAARTKNEVLRKRVFDALELFEELWPHDCEQWKALHKIETDA